MKHTLLLLILFVCSCSTFTSNELDIKDNPYEYQLKEEVINKTIYRPVYYSTDSIVNNVRIEPAASINEAGKIYVFDDYIFINEINKGFHILDNSDNNNPEKIAFMSIPGNLDIAVHESYLYADAFDLLLIFDISDINNIKLLHTIDNVFTRNANSIQFIDVPTGYFGISDIEQPAETFLFAFDSVETESIEYTRYVKDDSYMLDVEATDIILQDSKIDVANTGLENFETDVSNPMLGITLINNHLYVHSDSTIRVFDISTPDKPLENSTISPNSSNKCNF